MHNVFITLRARIANPRYRCGDIPARSSSFILRNDILDKCGKNKYNYALYFLELLIHLFCELLLLVTVYRN
jgi:hypothetical protein